VLACRCETLLAGKTSCRCGLRAACQQLTRSTRKHLLQDDDAQPRYRLVGVGAVRFQTARDERAGAPGSIALRQGLPLPLQALKLQVLFVQLELARPCRPPRRRPGAALSAPRTSQLQGAVMRAAARKRRAAAAWAATQRAATASSCNDNTAKAAATCTFQSKDFKSRRKPHATHEYAQVGTGGSCTPHRERQDSIQPLNGAAAQASAGS
jgi:hypothetical protein